MSSSLLAVGMIRGLCDDHRFVCLLNALNVSVAFRVKVELLGDEDPGACSEGHFVSSSGLAVGRR